MRLMFAGDQGACIPSVRTWTDMVDGGIAADALCSAATGCVCPP